MASQLWKTIHNIFRCYAKRIKYLLEIFWPNEKYFLLCTNLSKMKAALGFLPKNFKLISIENFILLVTNCNWLLLGSIVVKTREENKMNERRTTTLCLPNAF